MKRQREGEREEARQGERAAGEGEGESPLGQTMSKNKEEKLIN